MSLVIPTAEGPLAELGVAVRARLESSDNPVAVASSERSRFEPQLGHLVAVSAISAEHVGHCAIEFLPGGEDLT
jgi:hypothetical protein